MGIRTSLNMHITTKEKINNAASRLNKTKKEIIVLLLYCIVKDFKKNHVIFKSVSYQASDSEENWAPFQIRLKEVDYEFFTDFRNFYKMSVSLLLALATEKYLPRLENLDDDENVHNYVENSGYRVTYSANSEEVTWITTWEHPNLRKFEELLQ